VAKYGAPTEASGLDKYMKCYVYILYFNHADRYYIGSTSNVERRIKQHNSRHTYSTSRLGKFNLVFTQEVADLHTARMAERRIKSWKRRDYIERIVKDGKIAFLDT